MRTKQEKPLLERCNSYILKRYNELRVNGQPIPEELNQEMAQRFPTYDAETSTFKKRNSPSLSTLRSRYYKLRQKGQPIPDDLNMMLARISKSYDPVSRTFYRRPKKLLLRPMTHKKCATTQPQTQPQINTDVNVFNVEVKHKLHYNSVYVNGVCLIKKHTGTKITTFFDNTILAIYGTPMDTPDLPAVPMWQVYDTNMRPRAYKQQKEINPATFYVKNLQLLPNNTLRLYISNKMLVELTKRNTNKIFNIINQKTK